MNRPDKFENVINLSDRRNQNEPKPSPKPAILNVPPIIKIVVAVLAAIHVVLYFMGSEFEAISYYLLSFIPSRFGGDQSVATPFGVAPWTFFTYSLLHGDFTHLIFNSLWLLVFGTPVARRLSAPRFLTVMAISSAGGALATLVFHWGTFVILIGASAAVSGLMAAAVPIMFGQGSLLARTATEERARNAPVLPLADLLRHQPAMIFMALFLILTLFTGAAQLISTTALLDQRNIAWEAHLGGFLAGLLAFYALDNRTVHARG